MIYTIYFKLYILNYIYMIYTIYFKLYLCDIVFNFMNKKLLNQKILHIYTYT